MNKNILTALRAGAAPLALGLAIMSAPAYGQDNSAQSQDLCDEDADAADCPQGSGGSEATNDDDVILVTGSILRRTDTETVSPVTVLSADELDQRGINTIAEGLQRIAANGSGTISEGWNNGNNFAAGATAVSLRGLTVQRTLTVFDGLRMAPYPLADDGHRNFVDLNTIPDAIVDRVEVLKDGASSTYGADAVAGVVNVITKKEIQGVTLNMSSGLSEEGDGGEIRLDAAAGYGDLDDQGFNVYVAGLYRKNNVIWARDRDYPLNSGYLGNICNEAGSCMASPTRWLQFGVNPNGSFAGSTIGNAPVVAPGAVDPVSGAPTANRTDQYSLLNTDCSAFGGTPVVLPNSARSLVNTGVNAGQYTYAPNQCTVDMKALYATLRPETERFGFATRATVRIGEDHEAYIAGNYMHVNTYSQLSPSALGATNTPPPSSATWTAIVLPAYVCPGGTATFTGGPAAGINVSSCTAASPGAQLNPQNPFAAAGTPAILRGRYDLPQTVETNARSLRGAAGLAGTVGANDEWNYQLEFTASQVSLDRISENYIIPQRLADLIARGEYNFANPSLNSQSVRDYAAPVNVKTSISELWQASAIVSRELFELPGGPLQAAVGGSYRSESIDDESANPENLAHPYERYFGINAVGAVGSRNVWSAFYEVNAPVIDQVELNASGRYDSYSSGQTNFSPKFGAKVKPIDEVMLRASWSKGFRIPSFNEAFGLPTTGYGTLSVNCTTYAAFCGAHNNNTYATGQYQLGRTSVGNPALESETSTSWTVGLVVEPMRNLSFTVDYFNIEVRDVIGNISAADQEAALAAYFNNGTTSGVIPNVAVIPGPVDPQFPTALALPQFLTFSFQNADAEEVSGIDVGVNYRHNFGGVRWNSSLDATYLLDYSMLRADGSIEDYEGSLSPCDYTSCSGSPQLRATWSNTLGYGAFDATVTAYYTEGYSLGSVDYGGVQAADPASCLANIGHSVVTYQDGTPVKCVADETWNVDLTMNYEVTENASVYLNVLNVLGIDAPFEPSAAYSIFQYNPAWAQPLVNGRFFRVGARVAF